MTLFEWFKTLWPIVALMAAFGVRMEVGQALNKQRLREIDKDILQAERANEKAIEGVHARLSVAPRSAPPRLSHPEAHPGGALKNHHCHIPLV
jgi:hypothetical protein